VKKVGEGMSVEPSYRVVVQILGRGEEKQPWRVFVEEGIAAKATGLVESSREREGEEGIVWKKCMQRRCDGGWRSRKEYVEMRWLLEVGCGRKLQELM